MFKRNMVRAPICVVLSLLLLVDYAILTPVPAKAIDTKSVVIGAGAGLAIGAGVVLAAPAIAGAVGAAGGLAGIGTAIVGGLAAVGGALTGAIGALGGAIAAGIGAIGGFLAGIVASPLFIPALIIIAAAVIGYYLYKRHKKKQAEEAQEVLPNSDDIYVTPGDYNMSPIVPPMNQTDPISISQTDGITIAGDGSVTISDTPPAITVSADASPLPTQTVGTVTPVPSAEALAAAHSRYLEAYQKYTSLVTTGGSGDVQAVHAEYQAAYNEYMTLKAAASQ